MFALVMAVAVSSASFGSRAEIPHENYDLVGSDIDIVIGMLNASIRASEDALRSLYDQELEAAEESIDAANGVVAPAAALIEEIEDVAPSHEQLSILIPPFSSLHDEMENLLELEGQMLSVKADVVSLATEWDLSDSDVVAALDAIRQINILLSGMNDTIDAMLDCAQDIDALTVDDRHPFVPNELAELMGRLREMTLQIHGEIAELIEEGIPWQEDQSLLLMWIASSELHLGDTLEGGGYLLSDGDFVTTNAVNISIDGAWSLATLTNSVGAYSFSFAIPINDSWVGAHSVFGAADVAGEPVVSDTLPFYVSLVPTAITLHLSNTTISPQEVLAVEAVVTKDRNQPLPEVVCTLSLDGVGQEFATDEFGRCEWAWTGAELGIATHVFSASFQGPLPYAPCDSEEATVVVDVPTEVALELFEDRLRAGVRLIGDGTLTANASHDHLANMKLSLYVDGVVVSNVSTDEAGKFSFSVDTVDMPTGAHTLSARFIDHDSYWRDSEEHKSFFIISLSSSEHPFFPWIPGWDIGDGLAEQIPYLFFGEYAYLTWLFIALVIGVVIKAMQARRRRAATDTSSESVTAEGGILLSASSRGKPLGAADRMPDWLTSPNEKVIWHYHNLLSFLKSAGRMGITDDLTHWEVANLLDSVGYPRSETARVTLLYEKAQYSGHESSEEDVVDMDSSSAQLRRSGGVRPAV